MKVDMYDANDNCVNTIMNVVKVASLKDGRHFVHTCTKCKCCNQDVRNITQVPSGYLIEVKMEAEEDEANTK